jgi:hypothetical protein
MYTIWIPAAHLFNVVQLTKAKLLNHTIKEMKKMWDMYMYTYTYIYSQKGIFFSHERLCNYVIFRKIYGTGDHHIKQNKPDSERQIHFLWYVESRPTNTDTKHKDMKLIGELLKGASGREKQGWRGLNRIKVHCMHA